MWPFRAKQIIDDDAAAWIIENFAWLIKTLGSNGTFDETRLVLPKSGYFIFDGERDHKFALRILDQVKRYCGMPDWPVDLAVDNNPLAQSQGHAPLMIHHGKHALGTFRYGTDRATISYVPSLCSQPEKLITTLAHELAHYALGYVPDRVCELDEEEFLTDLCAVFFGFGVFLANSRFQHSTVSDGIFSWSVTSRAGYLPERDIVFALALFIEIKGLDPREAQSCLKPHLANLLKKALQALQQQTGTLAELRAAARMSAMVNRPAAPQATPFQTFYVWRGSASESRMSHPDIIKCLLHLPVRYVASPRTPGQILQARAAAD